jgi:hypothetical protein
LLFTGAEAQCLLIKLRTCQTGPSQERAIHSAIFRLLNIPDDSDADLNVVLLSKITLLSPLEIPELPSDIPHSSSMQFHVRYAQLPDKFRVGLLQQLETKIK